MQVNQNPYTQELQTNIHKPIAKDTDTSSDEKPKELTLEQELEKSAVEVTLSMGAQIILDILESQNKIKENTQAQKDIVNFLSGKATSDNMSLEDIGYDGKPITELSQDEAKELVSDDGFFGIEKTANRVADFVLSFAGNNLENLEKSRDGIVKGFEDAQKMWGGELPEISNKTQSRTLELIDDRIAKLKDTHSTKESKEDTSKQMKQKIDLTV